jgi:hypothetical protein
MHFVSWSIDKIVYLDCDSKVCLPTGVCFQVFINSDLLTDVMIIESWNAFSL